MDWAKCVVTLLPLLVACGAVRAGETAPGKGLDKSLQRFSRSSTRSQHADCSIAVSPHDNRVGHRQGGRVVHQYEVKSFSGGFKNLSDLTRSQQLCRERGLTAGGHQGQVRFHGMCYKSIVERFQANKNIR